MNNKTRAFKTLSPEKPNSRHILLHGSKPLWVLVNDTGLEIAEFLDNGFDVAEISRLVSEKYDISTARATDDIVRVFNQLTELGFLPFTESRSRRIPVLKSVYVHITEKCNLSCPHCYVSAGEFKGNREIPLSTLKYFVDELSLTQGRISFSGGEPLLYKDIFEILEYSAARIETNLITNGTLVNREKAGFLAKNNIGVQLSLDGANEKTHDSIRGTGNFKKVINATEMLLEYGLNPKKISWATVIMRHNRNQVKDIVALAEKTGVPLARFLPLRNMGNAVNNWEDLTRGLGISHFLKAYDHASDLREKGLRDTDISCGLGGFMLEMPEMTKDNIWCLVGKQLIVDADGSAYPCPMMRGEEYYLGNAISEDLEDILNSEAMRRISSRMTDRVYEIEKCSKCNWRNFCQAGCMGLALTHHGSLHKTDALCSSRKKAYEDAFKKILNCDKFVI